MDSKWKHNVEFTVRGYEADFTNRATVQTFAYYMEEAAAQHADKLGFSTASLRNNGVAWVLARMYIETYRFPKTGEKTHVTTWPVGIGKLQFRRDFELRDKNRQTLAKAVSQWVVVNLKTRKLERITSYPGLTPEEPEHAIEEPNWKITPQAESPELLQLDVRLSDIDQNNHVNNVHYIEWVLESAPYALNTEKNLASVEIIFRAEAKHRDKISVKGSSGETTGEFVHGIFNGGGAELVRAKTVWK